MTKPYTTWLNQLKLFKNIASTDETRSHNLIDYANAMQASTYAAYAKKAPLHPNHRKNTGSSPNGVHDIITTANTGSIKHGNTLKSNSKHTVAVSYATSNARFVLSVALSEITDVIRSAASGGRYSIEHSDVVIHIVLVRFSVAKFTVYGIAYTREEVHTMTT